jgi:hypothetical protein
MSRFFSCIPHNKSRRFNNAKYSALLRHFLGLSHFSLADKDNIACPHCGYLMDNNSSHYLDCKSNRVVGRHDKVVEVLATILRNAGYGCSVEPRNMDDDSEKRPADVKILGFCSKGDKWIDVAVVNPLCITSCDKAAKSPKAILLAAAQRKILKYEDLIQANNVTFLPLIFDVYGDMSEEGLKFLEQIAWNACTKNGLDMKQFLRCVRLNLVLAIGDSVANQIVNVMENTANS